MAEIVRVSVNLTTEEIIVIIRYLLSGCNLISPPIYRLIIIVFRRRRVEIEKKKNLRIGRNQTSTFTSGVMMLIMINDKMSIPLARQWIDIGQLGPVHTLT